MCGDDGDMIRSRCIITSDRTVWCLHESKYISGCDLQSLDDVEKIADNELNAISDTVDLSVVFGHGDLGGIDINGNYYMCVSECVCV